MRRPALAISPIIRPAVGTGARRSETGLALLGVNAQRLDADHWRLRLTFSRPLHESADVRDARIAPQDIAIWFSDRRAFAPLRVTDVSRGETPTEWSATVAAIGGALAPGFVHEQSYLLEIASIPGFDPLHLRALFTLPADAVEEGAAASSDGRPVIDYLTKDYQGFRQLLLNRISLLDPSWNDRSPADIGVMISEVLAYGGDYLSYYQDATATEAYLPTARLRTSIRRHARLLDYRLKDGCNSRVWVYAALAARRQGERGLTIKQGTALLASENISGVVQLGSPEYRQAIRQGAAIFETMMDHTLHPDLNTLPVYDLGESDFTLPAGGTSASLLLPSAPAHDDDVAVAALKVGDVLLIEGSDPGSPATAPSRHHPIRVTAIDRLHLSISGHDGRSFDVVTVHWHPDDALPTAFPVSATVGGTVYRGLSVMRGNMLLADFGQTSWLDPEQVPNDGLPYRPSFRLPGLVNAAPLDLTSGPSGSSAAAWSAGNPGAALPCITLYQSILPAPAVPDRPGAWLACWDAVPLYHDTYTWTPAYDLLDCGPFDRRFVVETGGGDGVNVRFGDGQLGRRPAPGSFMGGRARTGIDPTHIGVNTLHAIVAADAAAELKKWNITLRNPLPSSGAASPEPTERARRRAPDALRANGVCVTRGDFAKLCESVPGVDEAAVGMADHTSWPVVTVYIRQAHEIPSAHLLAAVADELRPRCIAGRDLQVRGPFFVPLDIAVDIKLERDFLAKQVLEMLRVAFSSRRNRDGTTGFFHPDNLRFGQSIYASAIVARACAVPGVASAGVRRLKRMGDASQDPVPAVVALAFNEVARVDGDRSYRGGGTIVFSVADGPA